MTPAPKATPEQVEALEIATGALYLECAIILDRAVPDPLPKQIPSLLRAIRAYLDAAGAAGFEAPDMSICVCGAASDTRILRERLGRAMKLLHDYVAVDDMDGGCFLDINIHALLEESKRDGWERGDK